MPRKRPDRCRRCGQAADHISKRGNCTDCAIALQMQSSYAFAAHEGPIWNTWCETMREWVSSL